MTKVDNNQFERMFGFRPKPAMTKKQKDRALRLNQLFDAMRDELEMDSRNVFQAYADKLHGKFIRAILDCPEEIEVFCQEALKPGSEHRNRLALIEHMKKPAQ